MRYEKSSVIYTERDVRCALPSLSLPETLLPEHVAEFGFIPYVEPQPAPPTLTDRRDARVAEIEAAADLKLSSFAHDFGADDGIQHLQLRDNDDKLSWLTLRGTASDLVAAGQSDALLPIRTAENVVLWRPASEVGAMLSEMARYAGAVKLAMWQLKDAARQSDAPEAIDLASLLNL